MVAGEPTEVPPNLRTFIPMDLWILGVEGLGGFWSGVQKTAHSPEADKCVGLVCGKVAEKLGAVI